MTREDFWRSTLRDINNVIKGAQDRSEELVRTHWETMRWQTVALLNVQIKNKIHNVKDLMVFPWEDAVPEVSPEDAKKRFERFKKIEKLKHGDG